MASENQEVNYEMTETNVAAKQEATNNLLTNSELNHLPKAKIMRVLSSKDEGESSATVVPDPFLEAIKGSNELAEIIAFNLLTNWESHITWLCSITKDQNIWTFHISLWDLWCSSYDFQDYLKMMFIYFWALQFRGIQVKLVTIVETVVYRKYYFNGNHWYLTTDEVDEPEKQFARKLFSGIPMVEIREDPNEVFGIRFDDNSQETE